VREQRGRERQVALEVLVGCADRQALDDAAEEVRVECRHLERLEARGRRRGALERRPELRARIAADGAEQPPRDGVEEGAGEVGVGHPGHLAREGVAHPRPVGPRVGRQGAQLGHEPAHPAAVGAEARGGILLPADPLAPREAPAGTAGHPAELRMPRREGRGDPTGHLVAHAHGSPLRMDAAMLPR